MRKIIILTFMLIMVLPAVFVQGYDLLGAGNIYLEDLELQDRAVLLFWTTWCPYCRTSVKEFSDICGQLTAKGYSTYFVNVGEKKPRVSSFAERAGISCPILFDYEGELADRYKILGIPTYIFLDSGQVINRANFISVSYVEKIYGK